jgi:branched-chain amino acid transport system permease protein
MSDQSVINDSLSVFSRRVLSASEAHAWKLIAAFALLGGALPLLGLEQGFFMTVIFKAYIFGVLALSWDLVGGQTGYPSFGQMAFFGIGAYTTALMTKQMGIAFPTALVVAGVLATAVAGLVGIVVLRLRGHYFAIATLGVLLATQQLANIFDGITGGTSGIILLNGPSDTLLYYTIFGVLVVEIAVVYYLKQTTFGYVLNAVRDDEVKLTAMGVNTTYYKTAAWMLAGLFTGFAGGTWPLFNTFLDPLTGFNLAWNVEMIAMALLGGSGTVAGPVLGAFGLHGLIALVIDPFFSGWQLVVLGAVIIVTVVAFPQGIVGDLVERSSAMEYYKHGGMAATDAESDDGAVADEAADPATDGDEMG